MSTQIPSNFFPPPKYNSPIFNPLFYVSTGLASCTFPNYRQATYSGISWVGAPSPLPCNYCVSCTHSS
jgi:hypothetical protein